MKKYVSTSFASGASVEYLEGQLQELCKDDLISEELLQQSRSELHPSTSTAAEATVDSVEPLFNKDTVYHAGICNLAVCTRDPGNYQQLFKDKEMVPGHSFTELSLSRSGYLIARQNDCTVYFSFQSHPLLLEWSKQFKSFSEGGLILIILAIDFDGALIILTNSHLTFTEFFISQVSLSSVGIFPPASLWNCSTNNSALSSLVCKLTGKQGCVHVYESCFL